MIPGIVAVLIVLIVVLWAITVSNRFKVLLVKISEADSGIDVALSKRYDTLTKLMDVVKAYTRHETTLLTQVVSLRSGMSMAQKSEANRAMDEAANHINLLAEGYPELRSSENYKQLQAAILDAEDHLQAARRVYNMNVSAFNQAIAVFPGSVVAGVTRHMPKEFFEADTAKRSDVTIQL